METILRSEEMAEIMLIPVRHHSPACACHIKKIFAQWKPDAVLVEGPDNANALLPVMVHSDTRAPFAIYYAYHDKAKKISQEQQHYKCYYPFLDYSPELTALREAHKKYDIYVIYRLVIRGHSGGVCGEARGGRGAAQLQ